jgi:hypothetical protein
MAAPASAVEEARLCWEGAKAAAEATTEARMAVFMILDRNNEDVTKVATFEGERAA